MNEKALGEMIIYQSDDGLTRVDVRFKGDTVWLSLDQLALLFERLKGNGGGSYWKDAVPGGKSLPGNREGAGKRSQEKEQGIKAMKIAIPSDLCDAGNRGRWVHRETDRHSPRGPGSRVQYN